MGTSSGLAWVQKIPAALTRHADPWASIMPLVGGPADPLGWQNRCLGRLGICEQALHMESETRQVPCKISAFDGRSALFGDALSRPMKTG